MKKKKIILFSAISLSAILTSIIAININKFNPVYGSNNNVANSEVLTFTSNSAKTKLGNTINLGRSGNFIWGTGCVCKLGTSNSEGSLYLSSSMQSIESVTFSYSYNNCYDFYCSIGSDGTNQLSGLSFSGTSSSYTMTAKNPAKNFKIYFAPFNTGSNFKIHSVQITYSCQDIN